MKLDDHLEKGTRDWAFLTQIETLHNASDFAGWRTVVLFYTALDLMDAFLHANGSNHGRSHSERERALAELVRSRRLSQSCFEAYVFLADRSRRTRYIEPSSSRSAFEDLVREHFRPLEAEVTQRLRLEPFARLPFER